MSITTYASASVRTVSDSATGRAAATPKSAATAAAANVGTARRQRDARDRKGCAQAAGPAGRRA